MTPEAILEGLLELAAEAALEVRVLPRSRGGGADLGPTTSASCRVGDRVWVVLAPDDPVPHQARVLAATLARYRAELLEQRYLAPALRRFIDRASGGDWASGSEGGDVDRAPDV